MIIRGRLNLKYTNDDYIIFSNGRLVNLSDYLNVMLLDDIDISIKSTYDEKVVLNTKGKLIKFKTQPKYYMYHVGDINIDEILWDLVGSKLEIELKNITK